jgi:hypothetical protein
MVCNKNKRTDPFTWFADLFSECLPSRKKKGTMESGAVLPNQLLALSWHWQQLLLCRVQTAGVIRRVSGDTTPHQRFRADELLLVSCPSQDQDEKKQHRPRHLHLGPPLPCLPGHTVCSISWGNRRSFHSASSAQASSPGARTIARSVLLSFFLLIGPWIIAMHDWSNYPLTRLSD